MIFLFNSIGTHIATDVDGELHAPSGNNIGHLVADDGIYVDMAGVYLGEIVGGDRLLARNSSPYRFNDYGTLGDCGNAGDFGDPGDTGAFGMPGDCADIDPDRLGG